MSATPSIIVVGSINMDLVARMPRLPKPGETVSGESFLTIPGGKGANQAIAAARLGASVKMIGRVGDDEFGRTLLSTLLADQIDTSQIFTTPDCSSGVAMIGVDAAGTNSIAVIPGANGRLTVADIEACRTTIESADALIVQLETPLRTVAAALKIAQEKGILTVLDPAPIPNEEFPQEFFSVGILSPNQTEAEALTGIEVNDWQSAQAAAECLRHRGANDVVIKLGSLGALVVSRDGSIHRITAMRTEIVDTTAAGDAFTAALTIGRCEGRTLADATKFACLAGALACTRFGAQPSMPTRLEVNRWLNAEPC